VTGPRLDTAAPEGTLRFGELAPNPRLSRLVERHWNLEVRTTPTTVRVLPDARVDLVFDAGPPVTAWIVGPRLAPISYTHTRPTSLLGVSLYAASADAVLGTPAGALTADWQPLSDVLGPAADALAEAVGREPSLSGRVGVVEVFLAARLAAAPLVQRVARTDGVAVSEGGLLDVVRSALRAGASPRNVVRLLRGWLGVGPAHLARILRAEAFDGQQARALAARLHGLGDATEP
jgi:hypothetical protein